MTYWHRHPRNFANECAMVVCITEAEADEAADLGYEQLTRAEAREHVRWINAENRAWGSNRAFGDMSMRDLPRLDNFGAPWPEPPAYVTDAMLDAAP